MPWWLYESEKQFKTIPYDHSRYRKLLGRIFRKYYFKVLKKLDNPSKLLNHNFIVEFENELNAHLRLRSITKEDELVEMTVNSLETLTKNWLDKLQ